MCNGDPNASDSGTSDSNTSEGPETDADRRGIVTGQGEAQSRDQADARPRTRSNRDSETNQAEAAQTNGEEESGSSAYVQSAYIRPAHVRLAGGQSPSKQSPSKQSSDEQRDWDAFAFQHEKLKHLTTVGLVLSGGIITLFQSELMDPSPLALIALVLPVVSSMLTLAAQVSLGNEASTTEPMAAERTRDSFGVPVAVHWVGLAALFLLASSLGWLASFFFRDTGLLP